MNSAESRRSAVATIAKWGVTAIGAIGGAASVAYVAGYLNRWSYLHTHGAAWLVRELTQGEILLASYDGLLPLVLLMGVALVESAEQDSAERPQTLRLAFWVAATVLLLFLDRGGTQYFVFEARGLFSWAASATTVFASVAIMKLGVTRLASDEHYGRFRAAHAIMAVAVAGFIFSPILAGRADALRDRGSVTSLPVAVITNGDRRDALPVLVVGAERVYCVRLPREPFGRAQVVPVPWSQIETIGGIPPP